MLHIPGVLTPEQVAGFRQRLAHSDWIDGRASVGAQGAQVKRNRQLPEGSPLALELGEIVSRALSAHPLFFSAVLPLRILPPFFNSYAGGEHYGLHIDGAIRTPLGGGQAMRADVSSTLFLSEPEEYQGGELVVVDSYGTHEVKLPAGDAIVYPSSSVHRVMPVTAGERVSSFLWTQSMVRDDWKRAMLFELDQNIQQLRAERGERGDSEALVGLAGHYHNLLRMWAEI
ncbi:2OG-Fe(II) oxygenase superfamily protein [Janthinobacterium agaricidamnosum NBRC 102515 = DSM 9628]|uniref:2OG-Fe(II) oxygenase superfamily protein n=2 Tax=Janthinobacterium agaricidamnosum TaxID=55508 RepID=W0V0Z7_9BURK|nr:2OG-Fe(II) oxygenase superfamily protein [Janthinobacterium agaricidamnosum NBRC 102515 = DSM 9628]